MIDPRLHREPVPVDRDHHRHLRLRVPVSDWSPAARLNAIFVAAVEFGDACRDYPVVFVRSGAGDDGKPEFAPVAVLGVAQEQNLYLQDGRWRASYLPAMLRSYPFAIGRLDAQRAAVCIDRAWSGLSETEGEPLFDAEGQPGQALAEVQPLLERFEAEAQRTRLVCQRLRDLDLLRDMRFDATLPGGGKHTVDGFLTVDESRVKALPDATVLELHKAGLLALIHAHWVSLGHMRKLMDWHIERSAH